MSLIAECVCVCLCVIEGECCQTSDGVAMRKGFGTQTSSSGTMYTGEWNDDKVLRKVVFFLKNSE